MSYVKSSGEVRKRSNTSKFMCVCEMCNTTMGGLNTGSRGWECRVCPVITFSPSQTQTLKTLRAASHRPESSQEVSSDRRRLV